TVTSTYAKGIAVSGNFAYVTALGTGLSVVDISTP
ncbi:unnamed protein product, partial [marine sediment metagenome]